MAQGVLVTVVARERAEVAATTVRDLQEVREADLSFPMLVRILTKARPIQTG